MNASPLWFVIIPALIIGLYCADYLLEKLEQLHKEKSK